MAARLDRVVEVRFLREYGNVNPHREERFDSFCIDFFPRVAYMVMPRTVTAAN